MVRSVQMLALVALSSSVPLSLWAQPAATMRYTGTVGQQHISLMLEVEDDAVGGGRYSYSGQKSEIRIVDTRHFGTTVVLQDEDGNILHLHFEDAQGEKAGSFKAADMLEGTLDRGELDLPIRLVRQTR